MQERIQYLKTNEHLEKEKEMYESLVETEEFKYLLRRKSSFIFPTTIFFLIFYFTLPLLAAYTKVLHMEVFNTIPLVWVFALCQFLLVWICGWVYVKKSETYDKLAAMILKKHKEKLSQ